jgi:hypothetical protein
MLEFAVLVLVGAGVLLAVGAMLLESVVVELLAFDVVVAAVLVSTLPDSPELQLDSTAIARTGAIIGATKAFIFFAFILISSL